MQSSQRSISMQYDKNRWEKKRVGTLRSQLHQLSDQLTRWCQWRVLAQSSCAVHMILEGCYISEVMSSRSDWSSDGGLGCNGVRPKGSSRVRLEPISGTKQVGEVLRGVGEVTLMGPK